MSTAAFIRALEPYMTDWRSVELKAIAEATRDGQLIFNAIRATLSEEPASKATDQDLPKIPGLQVIHERWDLNRLPELLESFSTERLRLSNSEITVRIAQFNGTQWSSLSFMPDFRLRTREECNSMYGIDFASYTLEVMNQSAGAVPVEHWSTIDPLLRASDHPWNGLSELRQRFVGLSRDVAAQRDAGRMQIVAPLYVRFGKSSLEGNKIQLRVEKTARTSTNDLRISVIATTSKETIERKRYSMVDATESPLKDSLEMCISLSSRPSRVDLFLGYKEIGADQEELFGGSPENPRTSVFEYVGLEKLQEALRSSGDSFEQGISVLFHLLGLSTVHYGKLPGEIPDVVAFAKANKWVFVIECTGRELNNRDKLSKLVTRSREIAASIPEYRVYSVIATPLPRNTISPSDLERAGNDSIIVITNDEITDLLQVAFEGLSEDEILGKLSQLTPTGRFDFGSGVTR